MNRQASVIAWMTGTACVIFASLYLFEMIHHHGAHGSSAQAPQHLTLHADRESDTDLAVTGLVSGLAPGATGYVRHADLAAMPRTTVDVRNDENFPDGSAVRVEGIPLEELAQALGASPASDLVDASCIDKYRAHYPSGYIAEHHPLLGLTVENQSPDDWARQSHHRSPGTYFITHANFVPAFTVLKHVDEPQVPTSLVRLDYSTAAATYGAIAPPQQAAPNSPQEEGFAIARQNCLRCHHQGEYGGRKSDVNWMTLGSWAQTQPAIFENYVHNPRSLNQDAKMPGNPGYDESTLHALTAYFRTFAPPAPAPDAGAHQSSGGR